jgi:hypothetical protein
MIRSRAELPQFIERLLGLRPRAIFEADPTEAAAVSHNKQGTQAFGLGVFLVLHLGQADPRSLNPGPPADLDGLTVEVRFHAFARYLFEPTGLLEWDAGFLRDRDNRPRDRVPAEPFD